MCAGALFWSKIGRVIYGADDKKNGYKKFCICPPAVDGMDLAPWPFHPKSTVTNGVLKDECAHLMKEFFKARR